MSVIILTGKSCSGKDGVRRELEGRGFENIVSWSSRPIRENEVDGVDYHFVNRSQFEKMIMTEQMIEYRTYNTLLNNNPDTWYYGLKKEKLDFNNKYVVILDLDGVENFIKYYGKENCYVVYMCCPKKERKRRAIARGSYDKTEWKRRTKADEKDFKSKRLDKLVDFTIVNMNNDIEDLPRIANIINNRYKTHFKKEI